RRSRTGHPRFAGDRVVAEDHPSGAVARRSLPLARLRPTDGPADPPPRAPQLGRRGRDRQPCRGVLGRKYRPSREVGATWTMGARRQPQPTRWAPPQTTRPTPDTRRTDRGVARARRRAARYALDRDGPKDWPDQRGTGVMTRTDIELDVQPLTGALGAE